MDAHVTPDGTKKEEYGSMRGRVVFVSDGDVSIEHVEQILHNPQLTKSLFGDGSPLLARIELIPAKDNPERLRLVERYRAALQDHRREPSPPSTSSSRRCGPISLVIPALRKLLSLEGG